MNKTNAMRRLDAAKIKYEVKEYTVDENDLAGTHIAAQIGLPFEMVFKTIVTKGDKNGYAVFCIPCDKEINLKRAASVTGNKKLEPVHVKDLLSLTGYIRGGCSPIGLKKPFPVYFDKRVETQETITISSGVRGAQLLVDRAELIDYLKANIVDVAE